jgi:hypothetical protein
LRRNVKPLLLEKLIEQRRDDAGITKAEGFGMILNSAC